MAIATAIAVDRESAPHAPLPRSEPVTLHDRAGWWMLAILVTTALGFQRTITSRLGVLDLAHAVHGIASTGWLVLLVVQAELARRLRRANHRQIAVVGVLCALVMCMSAVPMMQAIAAAAAGGGDIPSFLTVMDTGLLLCFLGLFAVAVTNVRRPAVHGRAMAATALVALPPGLGRWAMYLFGLDPVGGSLVALAVGVLWLAALTASDYRAGVRNAVYPAFAGGLSLVALAGVYLAPNVGR